MQRFKRFKCKGARLANKNVRPEGAEHVRWHAFPSPRTPGGRRFGERQSCTDLKVHLV